MGSGNCVRGARGLGVFVGSYPSAQQQHGLADTRCQITVVAERLREVDYLDGTECAALIEEVARSR